MPANPKYLSGSWTRFGKVTAAILGGYLATMSTFMAIGILVEDKGPIVMTTAWLSWLLWVFFMVLAFIAKKPWHIWLFLLLWTAICGGIIFLNS